MKPEDVIGVLREVPGMLWFFLASWLVVMTLLMPLFVALVAVNTSRMRRLMERSEKRVAKLLEETARGSQDAARITELMEQAVPRLMKAQEDLTKLRRMWMQEGKQE
jgi:hypothetical protein